ncbi:TPA: hypothetical protein ACH3X3_003164 [Trebouxia sp. C0006]
MPDFSTGVLVSENMTAVQEALWKTTGQLASDPACEDKMTRLLTPLFTAVMSRRFCSFTHISGLSWLDECDPNRANFNFRHVALIYQVYMEDLTIVDEDESNRLRRIKLVTKLLARIVRKSLSLYKVCHAQPPCV